MEDAAQVLAFADGTGDPLQEIETADLFLELLASPLALRDIPHHHGDTEQPARGGIVHAKEVHQHVDRLPGVAMPELRFSHPVSCTTHDAR